MQDGTSYKNIEEAKLVVDLVKKLCSSGVPPTNITILTLYEAQKSEIKSQLQINSPNKNQVHKTFKQIPKAKYINIIFFDLQTVAVLNVDGFQGRENDIIIMSFVRSNKESSIGFAGVPNRMNVALSRAKFFLFLVCNFRQMKSHESQLMIKLSKCLSEYVKE